MALSESVEASLNEASSHLRNALSYAARQERAYTCQCIAKVLQDIETIQKTDEMFDTIENIQNNKGGENPFGNFFK